MVCNDVPVFGKILDMQTQPQVFEARTTLHSTVTWEGDSSITNISFLDLHTFFCDAGKSKADTDRCPLHTFHGSRGSRES